MAEVRLDFGKQAEELPARCLSQAHGKSIHEDDGLGGKEQS
jgi:hypothetical protein